MTESKIDVPGAVMLMTQIRQATLAVRAGATPQPLAGLDSDPGPLFWGLCHVVDRLLDVLAAADAALDVPVSGRDHLIDAGANWAAYEVSDELGSDGAETGAGGG